MILHGSYASPYVRHCRIALMQSKLKWHFKDTDYIASSDSSPTQRVPFLIDQSRLLTDSSSIIFYVRELTDQPFIDSVEQMELFAMANTASDACINLFLLAKEGLTTDNTAYLKRQAARIQSTLTALNQFELTGTEKTDEGLRLACFLDWALYREQINIDGFDTLNALLKAANQLDEFSATAPWRA